MYFSTSSILPAALTLQLLAAITPAIALLDRSYVVRACGSPDCIGENTVIDSNDHGFSTCQNVPANDTGPIQIEAYDWCVNLFMKSDCEGPRVVAKSWNGACSQANVAGRTFGGPGTDLPDWTVLSYLANAGDVPVKGTQMVPLAPAQSKK